MGGDGPPAAGSWPVRRSAVLDWLMQESHGQPFADNLLGELCQRLVAEGIPLARAALHVRTLHPQFQGAAMIWQRGVPEVRLLTVGPGMFSDPRFINSPVRALFEGAEGIRRRLDIAVEEDGESFGIYDELRQQGMTDYVALPMVMTDGKRYACSWATDRPGGFTTADLILINDLVPALRMAVEIRLNRRIAKNLLNTYVGQRAGERVLAGDITRGSGTSIPAVIWTCDLRGFTQISERWPQADVIAGLNDYFDTMAAPVDQHGGEILKFIGDAMLAIFPLAGGDPASVAGRALAAARDARAAMAALNRERRETGREELGFGLALHVGEVMYGNIGSATRLDFTVIGPAVNVASRLEGLTKLLRRRLLLSGPFVAMGGPELMAGLVRLGNYPLDGVGEALEVFGLDDEG